MSKKKLFSLALCSLALIFFTASFTAHAENTVKISTGKWPPWAGKNLKNNGFVLHIVRTAFDRAGYDVEYKFYPWKRAFHEVKTGNVIASAYWYTSEEKEKYVYYSKPVTSEQIVFFHKKGESLEWDNLEDLKHYKIGASRGNTYTDRFWDLAEKGVLDLVKDNNDISGFRKLARDWIDIYPASKLQGLKLINENLSPEVVDTITYDEKPLTETTGHLVFSKKRDDAKKLMKVFNEKLQELKDDGTYDKYKQQLIEGGYSE